VCCAFSSIKQPCGERKRERERAKPARIKEPTQERKTKIPFTSALWNKVEESGRKCTCTGDDKTKMKNIKTKQRRQRMLFKREGNHFSFKK
jgi:hypothetical protein